MKNNLKGIEAEAIIDKQESRIAKLEGRIEASQKRIAELTEHLATAKANTQFVLGECDRHLDRIAELLEIQAEDRRVINEMANHHKAQLAAKCEPVDAHETEAWLIEWNDTHGYRAKVFRHNCVADYRAMYEDVTVTELVRRTTPQAATAQEPAEEVASRKETFKDVSAYVDQQVDNYEIGETDYVPSENEKLLIADFVHGLLADDAFLGLMKAMSPLDNKTPSPGAKPAQEIKQASPVRQLTDAETVAAAEKVAAMYDGDCRQDIKTDVLNSFYSGVRYCKRSLAAAGEQSADANDAERYRQIRKKLSDRHGDVYAMVFASCGDFPVGGDDLDDAIDAAIAAQEKPL